MNCFAPRRTIWSTVSNGVKVYRIEERVPHDSSRTSYLAGLLLFCWRAMLVLIRRHIATPYQLIHVHSLPGSLIFVSWLLKLTGTKIILDIYDLLPELYADKYGAGQHSVVFNSLLWVERASVAFADHVIAANDLWNRFWSHDRQKLTSVARW